MSCRHNTPVSSLRRTVQLGAKLYLVNCSVITPRTATLSGVTIDSPTFQVTASLPVVPSHPPINVTHYSEINVYPAMPSLLVAKDPEIVQSARRGKFREAVRATMRTGLLTSCL